MPGRVAYRMLVLAGATGVAVYILGGLSLALTSHDQALWPCNALVICVLLRLSRNGLEDAVTYVGVIIAGVLANLHTGTDPFLATVFGLANAGSIAMAVLLARRFAPLRFPTPKDGWKFCAIVGFGPPALGALCAGLGAASVGAAEPLIVARNWYLADLLGFLVLAPYGMTLSWRQLRQLKLNRRIPSAVVYAAGMAAVAVLVFVVPPAPMTFAILPAVLACTYRFRLWGAAAAVLITTVVSIPATLTGHGPFAMAEPTQRILLLQGFLVLTALSAVTIAALLNALDIQRTLIDRRRREAEEATEAKQRLLSLVSHEVRSPLSAIIGFGSLIENNLLRGDQIPAFASAITRHGELLKTLSDDLMDLAKADAGSLTVYPEIVDLGGVLEDLASTVAVQRGGDLVVHPPGGVLRVIADPHRYNQILTNLVSNALKYGRGHGPVEVETRRLDDGFLRVEVSNGGPGIGPEQREGVFVPFNRLGAENTKVDGAGIGLSITKQLVELQGGRIDFDSTPGRRTRFWVDMPRAA
jgi:signal transduction histidine kinase